VRKPKEVLKHFFKMFVDEYTVMLDPTCGSGNAVIVAEEMGASHALGIEKDSEFYSQAVAGYQASNT
jgi:DNA modification methylase